jgi:hypothetical protein
MLTVRKDTALMASLLYYFGILTLAGQTLFQETILRLPNQVARGLYLEQIQALLLPEESPREESQTAAKALYDQGDIQPVCEFIEQRYFKVFDNRAYRWSNELTIKTLFLTVLYNDLLYFIESEAELERTYADLVLLRRPDRRHLPLFDFLIEFKYVSLTAAGLDRSKAQQLSLAELKTLPPVQQKSNEAEASLSHYSQVLRQKYGQSLALRQFAIISLGFERLVWLEATET